ncbi:MAG: hypothetical protein V4726_22095 [Verrucomicrobiota bacterium]
MKEITEQTEKFRADAEIWLQSEVMIQRDDILDQIGKEGGVAASPPPPEPESEPESPDPVNVPAFRAAGELMKGEQFGEALTAFTDLAKSSTGKVRDQSYWNALLCGLITGNEEAVASASAPLLRSTPTSACYSMAAKAIQRNEWGDAQVWVTQASRSGDATESHTFQMAMESLGWADAGSRLIAPPNPEKTGG